MQKGSRQAKAPLKPLFITTSVAESILAHLAEVDMEHGGLLIGCPVHGDVVAYIRAPDAIERSRITVLFAGPELQIKYEQEMLRILEHFPEVVLGGFAHFHFGGSNLSKGDLDTFAELCGHPSLPSFGTVAILGIKYKTRPSRLRAWISRSPKLVEEMELIRVLDPVRARLNYEREKLT